MALTDTKLKSLKPREKAYTLADGEGLYVEVLPSGSIVWRMRYRLHGRPEKVTIGPYPAVTIRKAREQRRKYQGMVADGLSPMREKQAQKAERAAEGTVTGLCKDYYQRMIAPRYKDPKRVERLMERFIKPEIGTLLVGQVKPLDIDRVLRKVADYAPTTANDVLRLLKAIFAYGVKRHYGEFNPAADFGLEDAGGRERSRDRALSRDELSRLFQAIRETPNFGRENELAFKLLLATCTRKRELLLARWSEFDLNNAVWHLPKERSKTKAPIDIPLTPPVIEWLKEVRTLAGTSEYLFPARSRHKNPTISPDTLNVALTRVEHGLEHFTLHDLRRTARTHLAALGVRPDIAERALNHKVKGIEGIYNRHDYFDERKEALNTWASLLVSLEKGEPFNVVPMERKA